MQRIGHQTHVVEIRQKLEQRIARRGHQNFVARLAQQPKQVAVAFAGAGEQEDALPINCNGIPDAAVPAPAKPGAAVILRHGCARFRQPLAFGRILQRARDRPAPREFPAGDRRNRRWWDWTPSDRAAPFALPVSFKCLRQQIRLEAPIGARSKHAVFYSTRWGQSD